MGTLYKITTDKIHTFNSVQEHTMSTCFLSHLLIALIILPDAGEIATSAAFLLLLEKVPQDLFHSVYFEYEENSTHDRLISLNYAFCHIKRLIKTSEPVYTD